MKTGTFYQFKELCGVLFPSKTMLTIYHWIDALHPADAKVFVHALNDGYGLAAPALVEPKSLFVVLELDAVRCMILTNEGLVGWIHLLDRCKNDIEEVKAE
jgi:hypothetical protein